MKITFLGTGTSQGVPVIACKCEVCRSVDYRDNRLRASIHVQYEDGTSIVVDTGPDFRQQMLNARIESLDAIIYTHEHKDHTAGLDDVRSFNFRQRKAMPVYGRKQVLEQLKREFAYVFAEIKYPGIPRLLLNEIENQAFDINNHPIIPVEVFHHKLPVFGFRFGDFSYVTDANLIKDEELEKLKGSKVLVLNALQKEPHISHFTLEEALEMIAKLAPEKAYLTHISHRLGKHAEVQAELPDNVQIAYDGLSIVV